MATIKNGESHVDPGHQQRSLGLPGHHEAVRLGQVFVTPSANFAGSLLLQAETTLNGNKES
jgi:hypothetical protein